MKKDQHVNSQKPESFTRRIKVQPHYRFNTISTQIVPKLTLCGIWLSEIGFESEDRVVVIISKGEIIIRKEDLSK